MKLKSGIGFREGAVVLMLLFAVAVLFLSWRAYKQEAEILTVSQGREKKSTSAVVLEELESLLARPKSAAARYHIIAERNLFSPKRRAWAPPPAAPETKNEKPETPKPPPPTEDELIYFGSFITGETQYAIVGAPRIRSANDEYVVTVGDVIVDPKRKTRSYTILEITREMIVVKDHNNYTFMIGLLDHDRKGQVATKNSENVTISKTENPNTQNVLVSVGTKENENSSNKESQNAAKLPKDYDTLPDSKKEQLVEQGLLKKMKTPFGTVYKPAK